jgi:hypothetical protein
MKILRFVFLCMVLLQLGACTDSPHTPEQQILNFLDRGIDAAERRDVSDLIDLVDEQFEGQRGLTRKTLRSTLQLYFLRHKNIHLFKRVDEVILRTANEATVSLYVAMAGSVISDASLLGSLRARVYRFDLTLVRGDDWALRTASWQPATLADLQSSY